jgi:hypothetical protein
VQKVLTDANAGIAAAAPALTAAANAYHDAVTSFDTLLTPQQQYKVHGSTDTMQCVDLALRTGLACRVLPSAMA